MKAIKNIPYYLTAFVIFILLKITYIVAGTNDLTFLLNPTDKLIQLSTGSSSTYLAEKGYFHEKLNILIDKSCSGFNFWVLCFLMLSFLAIKFINKTSYKIISFPLILLSAYILTLFVNTSRILFSILFQHFKTDFIGNNSTWLHQAEGTFIYLSFLLIIYLGFDFLLNKLTQNDAKLA